MSGYRALSEMRLVQYKQESFIEKMVCGDVGMCLDMQGDGRAHVKERKSVGCDEAWTVWESSLANGGAVGAPFRRKAGPTPSAVIIVGVEAA